MWPKWLNPHLSPVRAPEKNTHKTVHSRRFGAFIVLFPRAAFFTWTETQNWWFSPQKYNTMILLGPIHWITAKFVSVPGWRNKVFLHCVFTNYRESPAAAVAADITHPPLTFCLNRQKHSAAMACKFCESVIAATAKKKPKNNCAADFFCARQFGQQGIANNFSISLLLPEWAFG